MWNPESRDGQPNAESNHGACDELGFRTSFIEDSVLQPKNENEEQSDPNEPKFGYGRGWAEHRDDRHCRCDYEEHEDAGRTQQSCNGKADGEGGNDEQ